MRMDNLTFANRASLVFTGRIGEQPAYVQITSPRRRNNGLMQPTRSAKVKSSLRTWNRNENALIARLRSRIAGMHPLLILLF